MTEEIIEVDNKPSLFKQIKNRLMLRRMSKSWNLRNNIHGNIFAETLELDYIQFQQHIFIEETKPLIDKLYRLDFVEQFIFPDVELYTTFCRTFYNIKYNLVIYLYSSKIRNHINTARTISVNTTNEESVGLAVFLNAINALVFK